jgi:hypothetical protein
MAQVESARGMEFKAIGERETRDALAFIGTPGQGPRRALVRARDRQVYRAVAEPIPSNPQPFDSVAVMGFKHDLACVPALDQRGKRMLASR